MQDMLHNYPDVLGYMTNGARYNLNVVQLALGVRPRVVRAGRPFEAILLIQNASDVPLDVIATLKIPEEDARRQKKKFITKAERLVVGVAAGEVGYVQLPISSMPDTAVGADYKLGMQITVKPKNNAKPNRIRDEAGSGHFMIGSISEQRRAALDELKRLSYATTKKGVLRDVLETTFSVMSGDIGKLADLQPGWVSLWTLADLNDDRLALARHADTLRGVVLPKLVRQKVFKPLLDETLTHFKTGGFELQQVEAVYITKLLTLILEFANPRDHEHGAHGPLAAGEYNLLPLLDEDRLLDSRPINLPAWCSRLLRVIDQDARAAQYPEVAIARYGYEDLLQDAMLYGFKMIEQTLGVDLGKEDDMRQYGAHVVKLLQDGEIDFNHSYMPLVLGGLAVYDQVVLPREKIGELLNELREALLQRKHTLDADGRTLYDMAEKLIDRAMVKYGYRE